MICPVVRLTKLGLKAVLVDHELVKNIIRGVVSVTRFALLPLS